MLTFLRLLFVSFFILLIMFIMFDFWIYQKVDHIWHQVMNALYSNPKVPPLIFDVCSSWFDESDEAWSHSALPRQLLVYLMKLFAAIIDNCCDLFDATLQYLISWSLHDLTCLWWWWWWNWCWRSWTLPVPRACWNSWRTAPICWSKSTSVSMLTSTRRGSTFPGSFRLRLIGSCYQMIALNWLWIGRQILLLIQRGDAGNPVGDQGSVTGAAAPEEVLRRYRLAGIWWRLRHPRHDQPPGWKSCLSDTRSNGRCSR